MGKSGNISEIYDTPLQGGSLGIMGRMSVKITCMTHNTSCECEYECDSEKSYVENDNGLKTYTIYAKH